MVKKKGGEVMKTGLVSVTFRNLSPEEIVPLAKQAGLSGIEWGGDIHVPAGDLDRADRVRLLTEEAGLQVISYGSYYRAGEWQDFAPVLSTAVRLKAPAIRIWAGVKGSGEADEAYFDRVAEDSRRVCQMAAKEDIAICYEYHGGTLTDTPESALELRERVGMENLKLYWQPRFDRSIEENIRALKMVRPWLWNVHAFTWDEDHRRYPLSDGEKVWKEYARYFGEDNAVMLEFVAEDAPEQMLRDAQTLHKILSDR